MPFKGQEGVEWEPIVVPLAEGVDVNTRARLTSPTKLLSAQNMYFPRTGGPERRKGHTEYSVKTVNGEGPVPDDFLYGYGRFDSENPPLFSAFVGEVSDYSAAGPIRGVAKRDNEELVWDGWRLYRHTASGFQLQQPNKTNYYGSEENPTAYFPVARSTPIAKTENSQHYVDCADNGVIRVVAHREFVNDTMLIKVYDSATGSVRFTVLSDLDDPEYLRVVSCGAYVHVIISNISTEEIWKYTIHQDDNAEPTSFTLLASDAGPHFDVAKADEEKLLVCYLTNTGGIRSSYLKPNGTFYTNYSHAGYDLDIDAEVALSVGVDIHPLTDEFCVIFKTAAAQYARVFDAYSESVFDLVEVSTNAQCAKTVVVAAHLYNGTSYGPPEASVDVDSGIFYLYTDNTDNADRYIRMTTLCGEDLNNYNIRYNVNLVSRGFRVGNVPFIIACHPSPLQTTYLLLDNHLTPCGKFEYGTANNNTADPWCFSVNYVVSDNSWETYEFHCALMYKQRVVEVEGIFHEVSTKYLTLNFMPEFRRAQAGRALYVPGAQLSVYDGDRVYEDNYHVAPEVGAQSSNGAGSLTGGGTYFYRVYPCHKNAQGEEIRGPAVELEIELGALDDTVTLTGATIPTAIDGTYFLVFRNANTGTLWYLVSNRDPSSGDCPKNSYNSATWTFTDLANDTDILDNELDPANAENYLQKYSAPACEVIGYGKNRLWVAGGELSSGTVLPSRLFLENETPSFHLNLGHSIDRTSAPITAIGFISDYVVAFKEKVGYIIQGDPADNVSLGDTLASQLLLADTGCVSHNSLVRIGQGLCFQSEGGIRLVEAAGNARSVGTDVDPLTTYVVDAVIDTDNRLIKFYQAERTLVLDYEGGQWTTWTVGTLSAADGLVAYNDTLWKEDDVYTDGDRAYTSSFRTANIGPALGGVHRFRRVIGIGETDANYRITCRAYYDDSQDFSEEWTWDSEGDLTDATWGSGTWGSGFWGDATGTLLYARDSLWRWRHRLARQKASCISIEVIYTGSGKGPVHTALGFEVGRKAGFDRRAH